MNKNELHIFEDPQTASKELAQRIEEDIQTHAGSKGAVSIVLSGGTTPKKLYQYLAGSGIDWKKVHVFFADERFVPHTDKHSSYHMVKETLLGKIQIPKKNIHAVPTYLSLQNAAKSYEIDIQDFYERFQKSQFDVTILGIGEDGHVASLFPYLPQVEEQTRLVLSVQESPKPPSERITLTLPALNNSRNIHFLATGGAKGKAIRQIIKGQDTIASCPSKGINNAEWWIDSAAAASLFDKEH